MTEKTIQICGHDVKMRYCAAAETGYEQLSGKSIATFVPTFGTNEKGEQVITEPAKAVTDDYLKLAISAIVAAYSRTGEEPPITSEDILYEARPEDVTTLLNTVVELRIEWYGVSKVVTDAEAAEAPKKGDNLEEGEKPKN